MKNFFTILAVALLTTNLYLPQQANAQSPQKMSYQAVVRNSSEALITNTAIGMKISVLKGSENGTAVYVETQSPTTNTNGLVSLEIGTGTVQSGDFSTIEWASGPYFIKTETDPAGGTSYTIAGTSQMLSVPFALFVNEIDPSVPQGTQLGDMQYWNGTEWIIVAAGNEGDIMTYVNDTPTWVGESGGGSVENPVTGKTWMDRNLGASQVATSGTDTDAYGDIYQWGRAADGHENRTSGITFTMSTSDTPGHANFIINDDIYPFDWRSPQNAELWQGVNGVNNPCPDGYRLPTEAEFEEERQSWSSNDAAGAFASPLKLTVAGYRNFNNGTPGNEGSLGSYWTSSTTGISSRGFYFIGDDVGMGSYFRARGSSVRCIRE